jgi:hypothetical protein
MGYMKELDIRIYGGGEDAIAAACELAGIVEERRAYDAVNSATSDITDIVTVLRGVGFAAIPPSAGESASLLLYCVTHAADEIDRLRLTDEERQAIAWVCGDVADITGPTEETLRGLLERTK